MITISEGNARTVSTGNGSHTPISGTLMNMITNMYDILEAIIDQILNKVSVMPFSLRVFCKFIY